MLIDGDVVLDGGCARSGPRGRGGYLTVMPRVHSSGKPNLAALRAYRNCLGVEEARAMQRVHNIIADIRRVNNCLDRDLIGDTDDAEQGTNILLAASFW